MCLLKEVDKYNERDNRPSGGLFAWIGGIAMDELPEPAVSVRADASVDELWNKLFAYEQSR